MTKPIEIIHQNFELKIAILEEISLTSPPDVIPVSITTRLHTIKKEYDELVLPFLCGYFDTKDIVEKCKIIDKYMQVLISQNFLTNINEIATIIGVHNSAKIKLYWDTPLDTNVKKVDYKICPSCDGKVTIDPLNSELRCFKCNYTLVLKGTVFEESNMYMSEGTLIKRGAYETSRHCRYHLERILAIKNPNIPKYLVPKIHDWLRRNNFAYLKLVRCPDLRRCLKEIKETKYNEHVPFIRQTISGISPERLFHNEICQLYIYFDKAVTVFNGKKRGERANLKYYPYFIFKIIEMILHKPEDRRRLQSIVDCIHFQRDSTIVSNDRLWSEICDDVPDFVFRKTDRNMHS